MTKSKSTLTIVQFESKIDDPVISHLAGTKVTLRKEGNKYYWDGNKANNRPPHIVDNKYFNLTKAKKSVLALATEVSKNVKENVKK
tara:strand:- start:70 stop:327 length:258 start_codon:yes stop_codon:yes gene_type:complete